MGSPQFLIIPTSFCFLMGMNCASTSQHRETETKQVLMPPLKGVWHVPKSPQTANDLAKLYNVPVEDITEINGLKSDQLLPLSRSIFIPGVTQASNSSSSSIKDNKIPPPGKAGGPIRSHLPKNPKFLWPVYKGKLINKFRPHDPHPHEGIDIAAPLGTAILATDDGVVIYSGSKLRGYGNIVILRHADGMVSVYAHNRINLVQEGDRVVRGQVIAEVGQTGNATTRHLHFEIRRGDAPQNPEDYLISQ